MTKRIETIVKEKLDSIHRNTVPIRNGGEIEKGYGYKPDRVYDVKTELLIIEIETSTDRKKHIGNYIKAHEYIAKNGKSGKILMIIKERDNTKLCDIARQISRYHNWINELGAKEIGLQIITISQLDKAVQNNVGLFTKSFGSIGLQL